jgi:hypothetical protein
LLLEFEKKYNDKTYDCELCGKKFNSRSNKSKHKDTCKNKIIYLKSLQSQINTLFNEFKTLKSKNTTSK